MSLLFAAGSATLELSAEEMEAGLREALGSLGERRRVLAVPPDFTRFHSRAGQLTEMTWRYFGERLGAVLPALGTHRAMSDEQIATMFGRVPRALFQVHDWRNDVVTLGEVPGELIREVSEGRLDYAWPAQVNRMLRDGIGGEAPFDLIVSIGQVVPHEVVGMANGAKNIFVGTGGPLGIHRSHFLGAVYGMERMMGRSNTPVRRVLDYASEHFGAQLPEIVYVQTVVAKNAAGRAGGARAVYRDGHEAVRAGGGAEPRVQFSAAGAGDPQVRGVSRSGGVSVDVAGQQERLPYADGPGRGSGAGGAGAGGGGVRRGSGH